LLLRHVSVAAQSQWELEVDTSRLAVSRVKPNVVERRRKRDFAKNKNVSARKKRPEPIEKPTEMVLIVIFAKEKIAVKTLPPFLIRRRETLRALHHHVKEIIVRSQFLSSMQSLSSLKNRRHVKETTVRSRFLSSMKNCRHVKGRSVRSQFLSSMKTCHHVKETIV
jgi:hypothetical protein